jgi:hypothetical protein
VTAADGLVEHWHHEVMDSSADEYQEAIAPLRARRDSTYRPLFDAYKVALLSGDELQMAELAERLDEAADELESLWTATLFTKAMDLPHGVFVNEAAGAMAMLSDLWTALAETHRARLNVRDT